MARPKNADGQRTRQAVLDAALDLFSQRGYFGTSLRDVATAVGVRESALYNYFASKDALFDALLAAHQHEKLERLAPIVDGPITDGRHLLEQLAVSSLESAVDPREQKLFRILMSDGIRLATAGRLNLFERMGQDRDRMSGLMRRLIDAGWLRAADPLLLCIAFIGPLVIWRQLHAINADLPILRKPRLFAQQHVEQFLLGAAAPRRAAPRPSSTKNKSKRRS
nr:Bacterial regulatory proteins, tetR family [uncultured bacterium]